MGSSKVKVKAQVLITNGDKVLVYRVLDEKTGTHIYIDWLADALSLVNCLKNQLYIARKTKTRIRTNLCV